MSRVSRRRFLEVLGAGSVVSSLPGSLAGCSDDDTEVVTAFFTGAERRAVNALANVVIPKEDGSPGGGDLGAAAYIERLLTAFDVDPPALFADGPYSGRAVAVDGTRPPNDFLRWRRIDRVTERAWRIRLYGSKNVEGGSLNEGLVQEVTGLRNLFKDGIGAAVRDAKAPIETLGPEALRDVFGGLDSELQQAFIDLVPQAAFGAPEYGGNPEGAGWKLVRFEGDTQPLGFSVFDEKTSTFHDRPDAPMAGPGPAVDPAPIDPETRKLLTAVVSFTGGKVFP